MINMERIITFILSIITALGICTFSDDYSRQATLSGAVNTLMNKKEIIATEYKGEVSTQNTDLLSSPVLTKNNNEDFVILNITDAHFADYDYRAFTAFECEATVKKLVKAVKPDMITISGDIVCTESTVFAIKRFTDLMESFAIPWAPVFGNHDDEGNCDLNYLADTMMKAPHCLMQKGDPEMGVGNYAVRIADENGKLREVIVMLDSHHNQANKKQREWVKNIAEDAGSAEVSLIFHVPLPEFQYAYDEAFENDKPKAGYNAQGERHESVACERDSNGEPVQRGFFDIIKSTGNIRHIICGHDHLNDFLVEYQGVRLTYAMKLGFGSGFRPQFNGGTIITVGTGGIKNITHKTKTLFGFKNILSVGE